MSEITHAELRRRDTLDLVDRIDGVTDGQATWSSGASFYIRQLLTSPKGLRAVGNSSEAALLDLLPELEEAEKLSANLGERTNARVEELKLEVASSVLDILDLVKQPIG